MWYNLPARHELQMVALIFFGLIIVAGMYWIVHNPVPSIIIFIGAYGFYNLIEFIHSLKNHKRENDGYAIRV